MDDMLFLPEACNHSQQPSDSNPSAPILDLIDRYQRNDSTRDAEELFRYIRQRFYSLARRMLSERLIVNRYHRTDDVIQLASIRLMRSFAQNKPESVQHFERIVAIAFRHVLSDLARQLVIREDAGILPAGGETIIATEHIDRCIVVMDAIDRLPHEEAQVIRLVKICGYSHVEAAKILDVCEKTIKRRLDLGRILLAQELSYPFSPKPNLPPANAPEEIVVTTTSIS